MIDASQASHKGKGFLRRLESACSTVIADEERLRVYECDAFTAAKRVPAVVVIPETVEEVIAVTRLCNDLEVPLVARGAGTGLSGGALPHAEGVLMVMAKFNRILRIDETQMTAVVEPGVTNLSISQAVEHLGLFYAPDPSSQIACTIGGNVAENSGGVHCLKYGLTIHNVAEVKVVLPSGELVTIGGTGYDSAGLDLLALMHGSEGMLGVVVEVTVRLLPLPEQTRVLLAPFPNIESAGAAVGAVIGKGILPAGMELMDGPAIEAVEAYMDAGYPAGAEAILLVEIDGHASEVAELEQSIGGLLTDAGAMSLTVATEPEDRARLWAGRKATFPAMGRLAPDYFCMDGTIPRRELPRVLGEIGELGQRYDLRVANVFHAGDGNLHPLILFDAEDPDQMRRAMAFGSDILTLCIESGGTITGEHGVGVEKINEMCVQFNERELTLFHGVKAAFDANGVLNPGKAVPTLSRCAEFGAMHVHAGEEKFPDLPRF